MDQENYYAVTCKCGHTGKRNSYTPITFGVKARNLYQAESIARQIPRVQHCKSTAILASRVVGKERFKSIIALNDQNPYLRCRSESDQAGIKIKIIHEPEMLPAPGNGHHKNCRLKNHYKGKERIRNPKTYMKRHFEYYKEDEVYEDID